MNFLVRAPAKVNLVLRVGPPRPDGYHDLASLMVPLDLADEVRVRVREGGRAGISCEVPGRPALDGPANLAARAAQVFQRRFGLRGRVEISIAKRIPVTAGLGGGSADAAAVLRALARAHGLRGERARAELGAAALEVGSDVPFFLGQGPAWARGRGEVLTPTVVPVLDLVLVYPRDPTLAIRAGEAFSLLDAARKRQGTAAALPRPGRRPFSLRTAPELAANALQGPCFARHPLLGTLAGLLVGKGATTAIMSGSGPTVFGIFPDPPSARCAAESVRCAGLEVEVHVARTLRRLPGVSRWTSPRSASFPSARRS